MTWQDGGVMIIVGAAVWYLVRIFVLPPKSAAKPAAFIPVQQVKSRIKHSQHEGSEADDLHARRKLDRNSHK